MVLRSELEKYLNDSLNISLFNDYGPNGLQVSGTEQIKKIAFAVSATKETIEATVQYGAQALIVHHGIFWNFHGVKPLTGAHYKRIAPLIKNDVNLFGYHLPLDAHIEYGNASSLAQEIGLIEIKPFAEYKGAFLGVSGQFSKTFSQLELKNLLEKKLNHSVIVSGPESKKIQTVGIITGGAKNEWHYAKKLNLDAYITGEMSEHNWHEALENDIHIFAGGHHATEKFGIQSLKKVLESQFSIETVFIDSNNLA